MAELCTNHPTTEATGLCSRCQRPFCDACTIDLLGQRFCGPCRDVRLREMQGQVPGQVVSEARYAGSGTVDIGGWFSDGWQLIKGALGVFMVASLLTWIIGGFTCGILTGPMTCGMLLMCYRQMVYGQVEVGNVFDGFRRAGWAILGTLLVGVVSVAVNFLVQLPLGIVGSLSHRESVSMLTQLLSSGISLVINGPIIGATLFMLPMIAARNVDPIQALSASWDVFRRNPLMFSALGWLLGLVLYAGTLACCVGLLVAFPLTIAVQAKAYQDHFGVQGFDSV